MPPSVLVSDDRADVESALASKPSFTDPQSRALYNWCFRLITALFNYVSFFLGDNADRHISLQNRVQDLEEKFEELQSTPPVPSTTPHPTPQQPVRPARSVRCKRCSAIGHDTNDCRTKDPVAVKKRVSNNRKRRKQNEDQPLGGVPVPPMPPHLSPFFQRDVFGNYNPDFGPTTQAFTALVLCRAGPKPCDPALPGPALPSNARPSGRAQGRGLRFWSPRPWAEPGAFGNVLFNSSALTTCILKAQHNPPSPYKTYIESI